MNGKSGKIITIMTLIIVSIIVFWPGNAEEVQASTKVLYDSNKNGISGTKKVDLTGDGKKETVKFLVQMEEEGSYIEKFTIKINGKKAFTRKYAGYSVAVNYIKLSSNTQFLWIRDYGDNYDSGINGLYRYQKSNHKLKKVLEFDSIDWKEGVSHIYTDVGKTTKSTVKVSYYGQMQATGYISWDCTYQFKNGKFALKSSVSSVKNGNYGKNLVYTANQSLTFYKGVKMKKKAFSVQAGDQVTLKKIKVYKNAYYLQFQKGKKKGWIKANQMNIFEGVQLAG